MGTPWLNINVARKFLVCRSLNLLISGSSVGPSAPMFQLSLWSAPSVLLSRFASLCFSLKLTRSHNVNPSCAVMKLIDAEGFRPSLLYKSLDPVSRYAKSDSCPLSPFQNRLTVSRYLPLHSAHSTGKLPTW